MNNPTKRADKRLLRVWSTISVSGIAPDILADDAVKQARFWEVVGRDEDSRFRVSFSDTHSDADMSVVGSEEVLLPLLTDLAHRGFRYHVDTQTLEDADRLGALYGESGPVDHVFAYVAHDAEVVGGVLARFHRSRRTETEKPQSQKTNRLLLRRPSSQRVKDGLRIEEPRPEEKRTYRREGGRHMVSVNRSMQAGYLTRDPELTKVVTRDGEEVLKCEFTLALNHYKESRFYVEGSLRYSRWEKEGSPRYAGCREGGRCHWGFDETRSLIARRRP